MTEQRVTFCEAIAREEGWDAAGPSKNRCQRNDNPGDICYGRFAIAHGATGTDGRFAIFPDAQTGFNAMSALLEASYLGMTLTQAIYRYAPPIENDTERYIRNVCAWTRLTAGDVLTKEILAPPIL
jgi:hypothetical protein